MTAREIAAKLRDLATEIDKLEPPPMAEPPPPTARDHAFGLLSEYAAWANYARQTGVSQPMRPELQAYVARNPPELRALLGGHANPMAMFREEVGAPPAPPPVMNAAAAPASGPAAASPEPQRRRWWR